MSAQAMYAILIVDDNPNNLFTLRTLLEDHLDAEVIEANSGAKALEQVAIRKIDLILLDVQMPEMDGFEVADLIRRRKRFQHIPIIFLTAIYKSEEFKQRGLRGGAIDYLTKPIDDTILLNRVSAYLRLIEEERTFNRQLQSVNAQLEQEIEERKRVEERLRQLSLELDRERALLKSLIDSIPDVIFYKDRESIYLGGNPAFAELVGRELSDIVGKTDFDLFPPDVARLLQEKDQRVLTDGQPQHNEEWLTYPDQRQILVDTLETPYWGPGGEMMGLISIARDMTERKHAAEELEKLNQQLQEASLHKSAFLANMSHELRTPLNAVIGYTSLTLDSLKTNLTPEQLSNLNKAERSARALLQLINDVLDFSKIEAGQVEIFIEKIDVREIIEEITMTAEGLVLDKPVDFKIEIADDLPLVESDYTKVKQVLNNLVGNAVKFTAEGSVTVRARSLDDAAAIRVEVKDTGAGIAPEKLGNVFESFKQAEKSTSKEFGGTGLGLAISKSFCDMLGIAIGVESELEKGTLFWLHIPLHTHSQESGEQPASKQKHAALFDQKSLPHGGDEVPAYETVLVIDDDDLNLTLTSTIFQNAGYTVYKTSSGREGIAMAQDFLPDVILIDLAMPEMNGYEVTRILKAHPITAAIPIVACTALATRESEEKAIEAGCSSVLRRPIEPNYLVEHVRKIVRHKA
ncbi:MAG: response regulator [Candidatus Vecturithrix sp.]|nr:response regulator [Candidatus Vecturithrix sp.]